MNILRSLVVVTILLSPTAAQAVLINFSLDGVIDTADAGNVFGLSVGDVVTVTGMYDDSVLSIPGIEHVSFGTGYAPNAFSMQFGSMLIDNTMDEYFFGDEDFSGGYFPALIFNGGVFEGLDYILNAGVNEAPFDFASYDTFRASRGGAGFITGNWDAQSFAVAEPGTLALFGIGLLGMGAARRTKKV